MMALTLFDRYAYPDWLRRHSLAVGRIAMALAAAHRRAGHDLDPDAVGLAGYLHDIGKSPLLDGDGRDHNQISALVVSAHGHADLAELVRRHPVYASMDPGLAPRTLAERIVHYADRRGLFEVVTLEERMGEQQARAPQFVHLRDAQLRAVREIERSVFDGLPFGPDQLAEQVT